MIRVRKKNGDSYTLSMEERFIEICDLSGGVVKVIYVDGNGMIQEIDEKDVKGSQRYEKIFGVKFSPTLEIEIK